MKDASGAGWSSAGGPTSGTGSEASCLARDVGDARARGGWRAAARELQGFVRDRVFRHGILVVMEQDLNRVPRIPPPPGVAIRRLEPASPDADWMAIGSLAGTRVARRLRQGLIRGRVCLVAWRGARAIGYAWLADRVEADLESFPVPVPPGTAYAGAVFVTPAERGVGVGAALMGARLLEARDRGYAAAWRVLDPRNRAALRTIEHSSGGGNRIVGTLRYAKLLGLSVGRFRPTATATGGTAPRATLVRR